MVLYFSLGLIVIECSSIDELVSCWTVCSWKIQIQCYFSPAFAICKTVPFTDCSCAAAIIPCCFLNHLTCLRFILLPLTCCAFFSTISYGRSWTNATLIWRSTAMWIRKPWISLLVSPKRRRSSSKGRRNLTKLTRWINFLISLDDSSLYLKEEISCNFKVVEKCSATGGYDIWFKCVSSIRLCSV